MRKAMQPTLLDREECRKARLSRDRRFDGQFFVAVKTTGIFCRPICPARLPSEKNVEYFIDKIAAFDAGYRPCLRCRPESAPYSPAWKGVEATFQRALTLIDDGALHHQGLACLSERLGISDRYLRDLFNRYLGMAPKKYTIYSQILFAKQLLHSTHLSITDIALASGFNSLRRFNDAFVKAMNLPPSHFRKSSSSKTAEHYIDITVNGEIDWPSMLDFYRARAVIGLERVTAHCYERYFILNGQRGWFSARYLSKGVLRVKFQLDDLRLLKPLTVKLKRMFDLDCDIEVVEQHLSELEPNLIQSLGLRIPGVWDCWEAGVRAILGQQVSVKAAISQLNLLTQTLTSKQDLHFPTAKEVANADLAFLRMPQSRKDTLTRFAAHLLQNPDSDPLTWIELKGIGLWTVNYVRLRGLSEPNCFLAEDLVVKKSLKIFNQLSTKSVSPWGSYATFHCWSHQ